MARRAMLPEEELVHVMEVYGVGNTPMARATNAREVPGKSSLTISKKADWNWLYLKHRSRRATILGCGSRA